MFEVMGGIPDGWEPASMQEWASLSPLPDDGLPTDTSGEFADSCDRLVDRAVAFGPGGAALSLLTSVPPGALSEQARCIALTELTAITAHVEAVRNDYTAVIAGPRPTSAHRRDVEDFASHTVSVATRNDVYAADRLISLARDLATVLKATGAAMRRGEITSAQAQVLHNATAQLPTDVSRAVETRVLRRAAIQTTRNFSRSVDRAVAALDPHFTQRSIAARRDVEVSHTAFGDGVGQLYVRGPLELTTAIHLALTAHAVKTKHELGGTVDQRKLAGLRDWAETAHAAPDTPTHHGRVATVNVVIELPTLLGLNNHPAEIPGVGPLPADAARWLLADGAPLRRLITDPVDGQLLEYGRTTYTVPPELADYLIAKNVTSASPHSTVDARLADMEHNTPHGQGGATDPFNCTPVDRRWHRAKTHGDWTYTKNTDTGAVLWTSPTGLTFRIDPYDYRLGP